MNRKQRRHPQPGQVEFNAKYDKQNDIVHINITNFVAVAIPRHILKNILDHVEAERKGEAAKPRIYLPA